MRIFVYALSVVAAAGIVYWVSNNPVEPSSSPDAQSVASAPAENDGQNVDPADLQLVSIHVPKMHCPFACYPAVKKTLEGTTGVQGVELAEQKEEGVIDNPVVIVKAAPGFDVEKAMESLAAKGFSESEVVQ